MKRPVTVEEKLSFVRECLSDTTIVIEFGNVMTPEQLSNVLDKIIKLHGIERFMDK